MKMVSKLVNGVRVHMQVALTQAELDQAAADALVESQARTVRAIDSVKVEAKKRILLQVPEHAQRNLLAEVLVAMGRGHRMRLGRVTEVEETWAWIQSVRTASDSIELDVAADPTIDVANHPGWPAPLPSAPSVVIAWTGPPGLRPE